MAPSPAHQWGQILGFVLERAVAPRLQDAADRNRVFLDQFGNRPARAKKKKVRWKDEYGNNHDLDYVFERNGTSEVLGDPVAFIEIAWRRYTKHSKNKAQEIQGAILPLRDAYYKTAPFLGAIVAGEYSEPSLVQMRSHGFHVIYMDYATVLEAFETVGIDASTDEGTSLSDLAVKVKAWGRLSGDQRVLVADRLVELNLHQFDEFISKLDLALRRTLERVHVIPLHGNPVEMRTLNEATSFVREYDDLVAIGVFQKYELRIIYNNGDEIRGEFSTKDAAISFLADVAKDHSDGGASNPLGRH